jgi:hypothetical protein
MERTHNQLVPNTDAGITESPAPTINEDHRAVSE